ncbi:MAG: fibronectin type III domain-containing protein [Desulfovibrio sp.]|nr:MAG: fibronectin type III domain-containing protein [Desulfovibrio sp.]
MQGSSAMDFAPPMRIIATVYNSSRGGDNVGARISFTDPDSPDPGDPGHIWRTMYSISPDQDVPFLPWVEGGHYIELEYYVTDASMLGVPNIPPSRGAHSLVNLSLVTENPAFICTKIEIDNQADLAPPSPPENVRAEAVAMTGNAGPTAVRITWSPAHDPGPDATGVRAYYIYRDGELYDHVPGRLAEHLGQEIEYHDILCRPGETHVYAVSALDRAPVGMWPAPRMEGSRHGNESALATAPAVTLPEFSAPGLVAPEDVAYLGAFLLPKGQDVADFEYASRGLAHSPGGNPNGGADELPGSLYVTTLHDQIAEIAIPRPVRADSPQALPRARYLQAPRDTFPAIYGGQSTPDGGGWKALGLVVFPAMGPVQELLYYCVGNSYGTDPNAPVLGAFSLDLASRFGPWHLGAPPPENVYPGLASTIAFRADQAWADQYLSGNSLILGNTYISGSGVPSNGPSLYATAPWADGPLPGEGGAVPSVELLRYGSGEDYDHWSLNSSWDEYGEGGAWLSVRGKSSVVVSTRINTGDLWYGYANGVDNCEFNIPAPEFGDHGVGATGWRPCLLFYSPQDLAAVAQGLMEPWQPKPYAALDLSPYSLRPDGMTQAGAVAYDADNQLLYFIEHNGEVGEWGEVNSLVHVFALRD